MVLFGYKLYNKNMKCEKIKTCGSYVYASCVKYEGEIPSSSKYYGDCDVYVEDVIEELYTMVTGQQGVVFCWRGYKVGRVNIFCRFWHC